MRYLGGWTVGAAALLLGCGGDTSVLSTDEKTGSVPTAAAPAPSLGTGAGERVARDAAEGAANGKVASVPKVELGTLPSQDGAPVMIIRTGNASVQVDSLDIAVGQLSQIAGRLGGYVANISIQAGRDQLRSATLELKIPAARFDEATAGLSGIGTVEYVNVAAQDVGEEFVDVAARVVNSTGSRSG